jgi:hypothetical protein
MSHGNDAVSLKGLGKISSFLDKDLLEFQKIAEATGTQASSFHPTIC